MTKIVLPFIMAMPKTSKKSVLRTNTCNKQVGCGFLQNNNLNSFVLFDTKVERLTKLHRITAKTERVPCSWVSRSATLFVRQRKSFHFQNGS